MGGKAHEVYVIDELEQLATHLASIDAAWVRSRER